VRSLEWGRFGANPTGTISLGRGRALIVRIKVTRADGASNLEGTAGDGESRSREFASPFDGGGTKEATGSPRARFQRQGIESVLSSEGGARN